MRRSWLAAACGAVMFAHRVVEGQAWTAQLVLSPVPSPFLSDWEVDPTVAELIVTNGTATATAVTFHYTLTRGSQVVVRGVTDPHTVPGNQSRAFNGTTTFGGRADWNRELQDLVARTGRLPEGEYEGCVALAGPGGAVLVERECASFTLAYPDPPFLVYPMNGDTITSQAPIFEWQPVQLPAMADARVGYVLQVAEVNATTRQSPEMALSSNILHYVEPGLIATAHQYPVGALPLVSGRTYAWRVQALDGAGKPIASNQGRSEIWTFVYREPESESRRTVARVELTASRDTLRFAGDTVRYTAQAYDADNVEIAGRQPDWRTLDTTIARVDSAGVVTAAGLGRTDIVATVDGVVDSAAAVIAPHAFTVRFETYDAANESPSLIELITSGNFEEVVPALMSRLESGDFVIPIPRFGGGTAAGSDSGAAEIGLERGPGGPFAPSGGQGAGAGAPSRRAECSAAIKGVTAYVNTEKKVFAVLLDDPQTAAVVARCAAVSETPPEPEDDTPDDIAFNRSALFVVSWKHPGLPRAFVALKGGGGLPLPLGGTRIQVRYLVVNLVRAMSVGSDILPDSLARFFGTASFDAGVGLTLYSKRSCPVEDEPLDRPAPDGSLRIPQQVAGGIADVRGQGWLCFVLRKLHPESPEITTVAFLGRTAAEMSVGAGGGRQPLGSIGGSRAYGFSIHSALPVRKYSSDGSGFRIDSTQVGLLFAVQDSITASRDQTVSESWRRDTTVNRDATAHGWSVGVSPTLSIWLTGSRNRQWQVDATAGLEWNPAGILGGEDYALAPKLVVSGVLQATWMVGPLRLGSPQFVFTTPLGQLAGQREATTLALSGAWGLGEPGGIELVENDGGAQPTDAGSARSALSAFEELGRGQLTFEWKRMTADALAQDSRRAAAGRDTVQAKQERDSATARVTRKLHEYNAAKQQVATAAARLDAAKKKVTSLGQKEETRDAKRTDPAPSPAQQGGLAPPTAGDPQVELRAATAEHEVAEKDLQRIQAELDALRQARTDARDALRPRSCLANIKDRCVTWKASLSLQSGAITDLLAAAARLIAGAVAGAVQ